MQPSSTAEPQVPFTRVQWLALLGLACVQFSNLLDFIIVMPLGPRYSEQFNITTEQFGHMVASYGFAACIGGLFAAGWIDRLERKKAMLALFALFSLGTFVCSLASTYPMLILARALTGLFGGILGSMAMTIVGDMFADSRRGFAIGILSISFSFATIFGIPLGLAIADYFESVRMPFMILAIFCVFVWFLLLVALPTLSEHLDRPASSFGRTIFRALAEPSHQLAYLYTVLLVFGTFTIAPYIATYSVTNLGLTQSQVKYIYIAGGASTFLVMPLIGRLADRFGKLLMFQIMGTITILPTLLITNMHASAVPLVVLATTFFMVCTSGRMVPAQALITNASLPHLRAGFLSVNSAVQHLACGLAASVSASILRETETKAIENYWMVGLIAIASMITSVVFAPKLQRASPDPETMIHVT